MAVLVSDTNNPAYDGNLSTVNGFYSADAYNMGVFGAALGLNTARTIALTFAQAGNLQKTIIGLQYRASGDNTRSVVVEFQQNIASVWTVIETITLTADQITDNISTRWCDGYFVPFDFAGTTAVDATASKWRLNIYESGGAGGSWSLLTSNGSVGFHVTSLDNQATFADNDCVIADYPVTIDQTATLRGVLGTGDTTRSICGIACKSRTGAGSANVSNFLWENPAVASYTLTLDGILLISGHGGFRAGTAAAPIAISEAGSIVIKRTPTYGSAGNAGFSCASHSGGYGYSGRKVNLFIYGEVPTYEKTTLNADAAASQADIVTTNTTGWAIGDEVYVGKSAVASYGDTGTIRTITNIVGTTITLSANLTSIRKAGGHVVRVNGYGMSIKIDTGTNLNYQYMKFCTNFVLSGCQLNYILFRIGEASLPGTSLDVGNEEALSISHCGCVAGCVDYVTANSVGCSITYVNSIITLFIGSLVQGFDPLAGLPTSVTVQHCVCIGGFNTTATLYSNSTHTFSNNYIYNGLYGIALYGYDNTIRDNYFWGQYSYGNSGALRIASLAGDLVNPKISGNHFNLCKIGYSLEAFASNAIRTDNDVFGDETANTNDIYITSGALIDFFLYSPTGVLTIEETSLPYIVKSSSLKIGDENNVAGSDKVYKYNGYLVRTGFGLADTNVYDPASGWEAATAGQYSLRFQPISSTSNLTYLDNSGVTIVGDNQGKSIVVSAKIKINNATFYAGTHVNPTLRVTYDNGTQVSAVATDTTDGQTLQVSFEPTTTAKFISIEIFGSTDATGSNAYFYLGKLSILKEEGVLVDSTEIDLWANALPLGTIRTFPEPANLWNEPTSLLVGAGTVGKLITDNIDAPISGAGGGTPPTVIEIRQEMDTNSSKLKSILGEVI